MATVLYTVLGIGVLGFALWDQFWTILGEGGGPITRKVATWQWRASRVLYRRWPSDRMLSAGGIVTIMGTIVTWIALLWLGWTFLFIAAGPGIVLSSSGEEATLLQRVYFSGYTLSTLGIGDVQPLGAARILTVLASFSGLFQISFSVAYLVPILVAATDKRRVSILISCLGETSVDVILNMWNGRDLSTLSAFLRTLAPDLALLEQRHLTYPVLQYFHSHKRPEAIGPSLAVLDETLTILAYGLDVDMDELGIDPGTFHTTRRVVSTFLETLQTGLDRETEDTSPPPPLDRLRAEGLPVVSNLQFLLRLNDLKERRQTLLALVRKDGWDWESVSTPDTEGDDEERSSLYDTDAL